MLLWEFSEVILPSRIISSRHTYPWREAQESEDTPTPSHAVPGACPQISPQIFPKANGQTLHRCPKNPPSWCRVGYPYPLLPTHIHPRHPRYSTVTLTHPTTPQTPHWHHMDFCCHPQHPPQTSQNIPSKPLQTPLHTPAAGFPCYTQPKTSPNFTPQFPTQTQLPGQNTIRYPLTPTRARQSCASKLHLEIQRHTHTQSLPHIDPL